MQTVRSGRGRRLAALLGLCALTATLVLAPGPLSSAAPKPPPNPSDQTISNAKASRQALADRVGQLSAEVAVMQGKIQRLNTQAELAEQRLALALQKLQQARDAATAAQKRVQGAQTAVNQAQTKFSQFVSLTYTSSGVAGGAGGLLTATDPNSLLEREDYSQYVADHQLDAIGDLRRATVEKSNADAAARRAVQQQAEATAAAQAAKEAAAAALREARAEQQQLRVTLATRQQQLNAARLRLANLENQRATYLAWQAEQARLARIRAAQAAARRRAAEEAARRAAQQQADAGAVVPVAATNGGGWSAGAGQTAVNRAMAYLGTPYSFAAGNYSGPTYGVAVDAASRNDGSVFGFDCSGLTLYAWAPYIQMDHYAATQYNQAGSYHPSTSHLMPGDLVFWSSDGTVAGIHHVAIYIGNGNVLQAPFSGSFIQITPLFQVDSGYYGATRPLT